MFMTAQEETSIKRFCIPVQKTDTQGRHYILNETTTLVMAQPLHYRQPYLT
jgi:hypothetical protein